MLFSIASRMLNTQAVPLFASTHTIWCLSALIIVGNNVLRTLSSKKSVAAKIENTIIETNSIQNIYN
jgi:hypothetical protein